MRDSEGTVAQVAVAKPELQAFSRRLLFLAVAAILALEAALFAPSFNKFFCGDDLFYLSRQVADFHQLGGLFSTTDTLRNYRPLAYLVFTHLMYPLSGLDPRGYHLMALVAHLLVSLMVFALLRRLVRAPAAALAGLFFFGLHAVNFYLTYGATFLPDIGLAVLGVASLLAYSKSVGQAFSPVAGAPRSEKSWRVASVVLFTLTLLVKESAVMLLVGLVAVRGLVVRRQTPGGRARRPAPTDFLSLLPFLLLTAIYLIFQFSIRRGSLYPTEPGPYRLSLSPAVLLLKLKYLLWLFSLPASFLRRGQWAVPPLVLMLPVAVWVLVRIRGLWRAERRALLLCCAWAVAALLPVLFISQVPMKHNLYFSVLALAVALAVSVDRQVRSGRSAWMRPVLSSGLCLLMAVATGFQVRSDLRFSWVGEGSDITKQSLEVMRRTYPTLPRGAMLYLLPTDVRGNVAWYFDAGSLFRLFYHDPTLQMWFADLGHRLTEYDLRRNDFLIFRFHHERLYDVTREYKFQATDRTSDRLAKRLATAEVSNRYSWNPEQLAGGRPVWFQKLARGDALREALVMLPGTQVRFPVSTLAADTLLQFGVTATGGPASGTTGRVAFDSQGRSETLFQRAIDGDTWWDVEVDLNNLAGRSGTLVLESNAGPSDNAVAFSNLRLVPRSSPYWMAESLYGWRFQDHGYSLLDHFDEAEASFDRSEKYPDYSRFATPNGQARFLFRPPRAQPLRLSMVTIAGAQVKFAVNHLPPNAVLSVSATHGTGVGEGALGRIYWEQDGRRELLFNQMVFPRQSNWVDQEISLARWAGQSGSLSFECSSGPAHDTVGDWLAWSRLSIISAQPTVQLLQGRSVQLDYCLVDHLDEAEVSFDRQETYPEYSRFGTPDGKPQFLFLATRAQPPRLSMVTIAGARVKFAVNDLPPGAVLAVSATHGTGVGDGARGRIYWEQDGRRELLFDQMVLPQQENWVDREISLARWAGQSGKLSFESSSGPQRNTVGDWFAWGRLCIASK